jgi:hypothetical protein
LFELVGGGEADALGAGLAKFVEGGGVEGFAGELLEERLGIEGVDLGGAAVHEEVDDAFGGAGELGIAGCEGIAVGGGEALFGEEGGEGEGAEAEAVLLEEGATVHGGWWRWGEEVGDLLS